MTILKWTVKTDDSDTLGEYEVTNGVRTGDWLMINKSDYEVINVNKFDRVLVCKHRKVKEVKNDKTSTKNHK